NSAEQLVYQTEKVLADNADKVSDEVKTEVQEAIGELKTALEGEDIEAVKAKQTALMTASQKIGEALYSQDKAAAGAAPGGDAPAGDATGSDEDVVDAEIVDEDETK